MEQLDWLLYKKLQTRKFKGNLDLEGLRIPLWFRIPDNLQVSGYLDLSYSNISKLPKNLQCENLYLNNCKNIKELSENLKVEQTINLYASSIEQLPKNLQCYNLGLQNCKNLKELPEGLKVKYLYIEDSLSKIYCEKMKQEGKISYNILYL